MQKTAKKGSKMKQKKTEFKAQSNEIEEIKPRIVNRASNSKLPGINSNFFNAEESKTKRKLIQSQDNNESSVKKQRLTASERYQRYMDEEERVRAIEDELADPNIEPHTPDQFERALMKDKNSSFMWIKYMAFHLETAEIEKARAVARKAVASINYREEKELLNVWIALLNLEIRYGTDESFNEVLRDATQRNDPFKIYSQTLTVLLEMEKFDDANKIVDVLKKRFKPLPEMWLLIGEAYLRMGNEKLAKEALPKSLLSLKDVQHVDFMVKYALMTSRYDLHDFAQTIFEKLLSSYNKKLNIWFTYIDMMIKFGHIEIARSLFERLIIIKFPLKKLKSVFQKYIEFESKHGESSNVTKIKKMAKKLLEKDEDEENE